MVNAPFSFQGRALNGDQPTPRTLEARAYDTCASAGQSFEITDLRINVYALR